jgi:hypothetical protein
VLAFVSYSLAFTEQRLAYEWWVLVLIFLARMDHNAVVKLIVEYPFKERFIRDFAISNVAELRQADFVGVGLERHGLLH